MENYFSTARGALLFVSLFVANSVFAMPPFIPATAELVHSNDLTPSMDGRFSSFLEPSVNTSGTIVFNARLFDTDDGNLDNSGIYRLYSPAAGISPAIISLQEVIREGDSYSIGGNSYSIGDVFLTAFRLEDAPPIGIPAIGQFSALALRLPVTSGNSTGNTILAVEDSQANLQLIAQAGGDVPNGNGTFREFNAFSMSDISANGGVNFAIGLDDTAGGDADNVAIFRYLPDGTVQEIVRRGDPQGGGVFTGVGSVRSNDLGGGAFIGVDDAGDPANDTAIYRFTSLSTSYTRIVGEGDAAPSDDPDPRFFSQTTEHRYNNDDFVGFAGLLRDDNGFAVQDGSGLYRANTFGVQEIVREGQLTPDATASFGRFASSFSGDIPRSPFNDLEQFAFTVDLILEDGSGQSTGVFRASVDELIEIAREGDNYEDGTLFDFADPALNNFGLVAFDAELNLGVENGPEGPFITRSQVLILTDGMDYVTVAREGQQVNGRTIDEIFFNNSPIGIANGLSDLGTVVYEVRYTDGTSAINRWRAQLGWRSQAGDGIWDDESNWFFNMPPNLESNVEINPDTDANVEGPADDTIVNSLSFGNGAGNVNLNASAGSITTFEGINIGNNGVLNVDAGQSLLVGGDINNNGVITLGNNAELLVQGVFSGDGPINGAEGTSIFDGELSPGNSPGLLTIEGDAVLSDANTTILELAGLIRGDEFDGIDVGGSFTLDGVLEIVLLSGFTPTAGDTFLLFQAGQLLGDFNEILLPEIAGLVLLFDRTQTSLSLNVQPVPLPATFWLFISAFFLLIKKRVV